MTLYVHQWLTYALLVINPNNGYNIVVTAGVAQLIRASDCGSEGRGFDPHHSPQKLQYPVVCSKDAAAFYYAFLMHAPEPHGACRGILSKDFGKQRGI